MQMTKREFIEEFHISDANLEQRQRIDQAKQEAHQAAGIVLAGLSMLRKAHKKVEIRTGTADAPYYHFLDGNPGRHKIKDLEEALHQYRNHVQF